MPTPSNLDGVLVQWGDRLFYLANRIVRAHTPKLTGVGIRERAHAIRQRIHAIVVRRAPQVMVKVAGGGRGMAAIAAHLRYISKGGRLPIEDDRGFEREGKEALRDLVKQWRLGGSRIPEISERREAFNIMLSMPVGTKAEILQSAAREFAKAELANHRYVMVLHTHQANPHVHLSVRAEGRDGQRLNPRKEDLRRWRETFAERLRGWGIEAEASSQVTRGTRHRNERVWERKTGLRHEERSARAEALPSGTRRQALQAWAEIMRSLAASPEESDRKLAQSIGHYLGRMPAVHAMVREHAQQRELPSMSRSPVTMPSQQRRGPEIER
jgi:Relaxase/Mobilisation nuclease domain